MRTRFTLSIAFAGLATLGFHLLRAYPWALALLVGIAIGALCFVALHNAARLLRHFREPVVIVERRGGDGDENTGSSRSGS